jgi:hypothetical protein
MTLLQALQHAFIGYGIRRACWPEDSLLKFDMEREALIDVEGIQEGQVYTIQPKDIEATDWETN